VALSAYFHALGDASEADEPAGRPLREWLRAVGISLPSEPAFAVWLDSYPLSETAQMSCQLGKRPTAPRVSTSELSLLCDLTPPAAHISTSELSRMGWNFRRRAWGEASRIVTPTGSWAFQNTAYSPSDSSDKASWTLEGLHPLRDLRSAMLTYSTINFFASVIWHLIDTAASMAYISTFDEERYTLGIQVSRGIIGVQVINMIVIVLRKLRRDCLDFCSLRRKRLLVLPFPFYEFGKLEYTVFMFGCVIYGADQVTRESLDGLGIFATIFVSVAAGVFSVWLIMEGLCALFNSVSSAADHSRSRPGLIIAAASQFGTAYTSKSSLADVVL